MYYDIKASGMRIKKLRKAKGLTQEQLSARLNISDSYLRKMEYGLYSGSLDLLIEMAEVFDVSLDYLILGRQQPRELLKRKVRSMIEFLTALEREL